jgi:phosphatidylserine/phosphatidylglycerophosphate/cardiolipin synthase-like enzyme
VNRDGEKNLRQLETRFLQAGITVARSADDLIRYHDKLIIIDRRILYILSFNFTHQDIDHSRGFGIVTKNATLVQEAVKLFEADCARGITRRAQIRLSSAPQTRERCYAAS